ncbi:hypothetical protein DXZ20_06550 [Leptolyngbyaceae cyanobacterium CCMR0081]|uniref:Uncharacterized protein n=1 Tax=Adonisia turfae CCMR0081 TaxID=2292702 RepID=A0A6M0RHX8_9CYAN|nr:hypothetical protein [Adonisia turfae CCMR0081]
MTPDFLKPYAQEKEINKLEVFSLEVYKTLLSIQKSTTEEEHADLQTEAIMLSINMLYRLKEAQTPTNSDLN